MDDAFVVSFYLLGSLQYHYLAARCCPILFISIKVTQRILDRQLLFLMNVKKDKEYVL